MIDTDDSWASDSVPPARKAAVDALVGSRLRLYREVLNWSPEDLAGALHLDPATLSDYEAGRVRVSPADLTEIAKIFQIPVIWFFVGLAGPGAETHDGSSVFSESEERVAGDRLAMLTQELSQVSNSSTRILLIDMARSLARHFR